MSVHAVGRTKGLLRRTAPSEFALCFGPGHAEAFVSLFAYCNSDSTVAPHTRVIGRVSSASPPGGNPSSGV